MATKRKGPKRPTAAQPAPLKVVTVNDRPGRRACLWCGKVFNSRGPHHRQCPACAKAEKAGGKGPGGVLATLHARD